MSVTNLIAGCGNSTSYPDIWNQAPHDVTTGDNCYMSRSRKDTVQTVSVATDVTEMELPLKWGSSYSFSYDILYSTTGLLCGAQFALTFSGTVASIGYGITLTTVANSVVSDATTTAGTFIGSGASVAGGGPKTCRIFGSIKTGSSTLGGNLVLRMQPTGVAASVTIHPNSCGKAEEQ